MYQNSLVGPFPEVTGGCFADSPLPSADESKLNWRGVVDVGGHGVQREQKIFLQPSHLDHRSRDSGELSHQSGT